MEEEYKSYEISFLGKGEESAASVIGHLKHLGAEILKEEKIEQITLAYEIKKHTVAHFGCIHFALKPEDIHALKEALKFEEGILRYLIITPPFASADQKQIRNNISQPKDENRAPDTQPTQSSGSVSNEDLEAKLEEISESISEV